MTLIDSPGLRATVVLSLIEGFQFQLARRIQDRKVEIYMERDGTDYSITAEGDEVYRMDAASLDYLLACEAQAGTVQ